MTRTAVLISGQLRTFATVLGNVNWTVFRNLPEPTFFISCADDENGPAAELLLRYQPRVHIELVNPPDFSDTAWMGEPLENAGFGRGPGAPEDPEEWRRQMLNQHWHNLKAWDLFDRTTELDDPFDQVMRMRADLHFQRFDVPRVPYPDEFIGCWKGTFGGVNDRLAVMGLDAARAYFTAFTALPDIIREGCPLHHETIAQYAMERKGIHICNTLMAEYMCIREHPTEKNPHMPLLEMAGEFARFVATKLDRAVWEARGGRR